MLYELYKNPKTGRIDFLRLHCLVADQTQHVQGGVMSRISLTARLDVGIQAQNLELALVPPNSIVWMVLVLAFGNGLQYHAAFSLPAQHMKKIST